MMNTLILLADAETAVPALVAPIDSVTGPFPWANLGYLVAAVLFILGIKGMTHPRTAVRGNLLGALGMLLAVVVTLIKTDVSYWILLPGMVVGGAARPVRGWRKKSK